MKISIQTAQHILSAQCLGSFTDTLIEWISIDSRSLQNNRSTLFFALQGKNHDGHKYIPGLIEKGVAVFVVSQLPEDNWLNKAFFLVVKDTLLAFQKMATYHRNSFNLPLIAITGSNGKTIVKEWLSFLLDPDYVVVKSPKSYNSQIGVPLSIFSINDKHTMGIFEAGISTVSEMDKLQHILKPSIGILTNIGSAHDEGFSSRGEKIKEKLLLFKHCKTIIYKKDVLVDQLISHIPADLISWSFEDETADFVIEKNTIDRAHTQLTVLHENNKNVYSIPFVDIASVENAVSCIITLLFLGYDFDLISERIKGLYPVNMRLQVKPGINNSTLIDDSYSSDFQSLKIALDFLENQTQSNYKTVILSDIEQTGLSDQELYTKIFDLLIANNVKRVIAVGTVITKYASVIKSHICFQTTEDFLAALPQIKFKDEVVLVKGARSFHFEKIIKSLEHKTHETILEINLNAVSHNLNYYKSKLAPQTKVMVMVKAFGYGSGGYELAKLLSYHHIDYLGVAFADEGIALRESGIKTPIMVMNPDINSFKAIIQHDLEPEIYSLRILEAFLAVASSLKTKKYPIHIKIDTGMHRLGFEQKDIFILKQKIKSTTLVTIKSIFSHLAATDDLQYQDFTIKQITLFENLSKEIISELPYIPIRHILNTSGISNYSRYQYDMVRLGIGLYGVSNDASESNYLQNVSTLKSVISQIKTISVGDSVGYSRKFIAQKPTKTATIPIGYADGISRSLSNGLGYVMIKNKQAYIVGSVCMDMLMVDITDIDCQEGDEVVVFGENLRVSLLANQLNTISYEILTGISHRVKRIFFRD